MSKPATLADEFKSALKEHAPAYALQLTTPEISRLGEYYEQVMAWNTRLHLVAPCSPAEFATRHILESLLALKHLPAEAHILDVGSGAGLPIIPCLIVRPALRATLIESSPKKAIFLREALRRVAPQSEATVIVERFEKTRAPAADFLTCRALDRFVETLPRLIEWAPRATTLLLFGGEGLRAQLSRAALSYQAVLIPESERRYLFIVNKASKAQSPQAES
jgi:16S rRNA (guanine527-N7)-methyltransferase